MFFKKIGFLFLSFIAVTAAWSMEVEEGALEKSFLSQHKKDFGQYVLDVRKRLKFVPTNNLALGVIGKVAKIGGYNLDSFSAQCIPILSQFFGCKEYNKFIDEVCKGDKETLEYINYGIERFNTILDKQNNKKTKKSNQEVLSRGLHNGLLENLVKNKILSQSLLEELRQPSKFLMYIKNNKISTEQFANLVARNLFIQYLFKKGPFKGEMHHC